MMSNPDGRAPKGAFCYREENTCKSIVKGREKERGPKCDRDTIAEGPYLTGVPLEDLLFYVL